MKNKTEISNTVEAALFSAEEPLSTKDLRGMFKPEDAPATDELNAILDQLASDYHGRGIEGFQILDCLRDDRLVLNRLVSKS